MNKLIVVGIICVLVFLSTSVTSYITATINTDLKIVQNSTSNDTTYISAIDTSEAKLFFCAINSSYDLLNNNELLVSLDNNTYDFSGNNYHGVGNSLNKFSSIWYEQNGNLYDGAMGTYTMKHRPLAVYIGSINRTYFVYGGGDNSGYISYYEHATDEFAYPTKIFEYASGDAHKNPSLLVDSYGNIYVFIGAHTSNMYVYRSDNPYDITSFSQKVNLASQSTYPQAWEVESGKIIAFYRDLYDWRYRTSTDNCTSWSSPSTRLIKYNNTFMRPYLVSIIGDETPTKKVHVAWTMRNWSASNERVDVFYLYSEDAGVNWKNITGDTILLPINETNSLSALVYDSGTQNTNMKDIRLNSSGIPFILFLEEFPSEFVWRIARYDDDTWNIINITTSDHAFDSGELIFYNDTDLRAFLPTGVVQANQDGGEVQEWKSIDNGNTWTNSNNLTTGSTFSHNYIRAVFNSTPEFRIFWSYGDSSGTPKNRGSNLYFWGENQDSVRVMNHSYNPSLYGYAPNFEVDSYVSMGDNINLGVDDFTIESWIRPNHCGDGTTALCAIVSEGQTASGEWIFYNSADKLRFYGDGGNIDTTAAYSISYLKWQHVAFVRDGDNGYLYYNGSLVKSISGIDNVNLNSTKDLVIGASEEGTDRFFVGLIDDFKLHKRALSSDEINASFNLNEEDYFTTYNVISDSAITYKSIMHSNLSYMIDIPETGHNFTFNPTNIIENQTSILFNTTDSSYYGHETATVTPAYLGEQNLTRVRVTNPFPMNMYDLLSINLSYYLGWNPYIIDNRVWTGSYTGNTDNSTLKDIRDWNIWGDTYPDNDIGLLLSINAEECPPNSNTIATIFKDRTTYNNHGFPKNFDNTSTSGCSDGYNGQGIRFDGVNDSVDCGTDNSLNLTNDYTISFWINADDDWNVISSDQGIFDSGTDVYEYHIFLQIDSYTNQLQYVTKSGETRSSFSDKSLWNANQWYQIVIVHNSSNYILWYIDGVLDDVDSFYTLNTGYYTGLDLGRRFTVTDGSYFDGILDELQIWNYTRTPTQILANYEAHEQQYDSIPREELGIIASEEWDIIVQNGTVTTDSCAPIRNNDWTITDVCVKDNENIELGTGSLIINATAGGRLVLNNGVNVYANDFQQIGSGEHIHIFSGNVLI